MDCHTSFPHNPDLASEDLGKNFTEMETWKALFDMAPLKTPSIDGFHNVFFQTYWELTNDLINAFAKVALSTDQIDGSMNQTYHSRSSSGNLRNLWPV